MSRYTQLAAAVDLIKPRSIVEIGTNRGASAVLMIKQAQKYRKNIQYVGYDLFEEADEKTDAEEMNAKKRSNKAAVEAYILKECPNAEINLIKGNTRQTLNPLIADLVFIDGGHSRDTIENDFERVKHSSLIILDDYYSPDEQGTCPDLDKFGCNKLLESIDRVILLPLKTKIKMGGYTQMAMLIGEKLI